MVRAQWRNRTRPPSILLGTAVIVAAAMTVTAALSVAARPAALAACPTSATQATRAAAARSDRPVDLSVADRLTQGGELSGRALRLLPAGGSARVVSLPAESFIGVRIGDLVVYTRADSVRGSEVHLLNVASGCDTVVARPAGVVRSAILSPDRSAIYVHTVARGSRRDAGVTRHDLATDTSSKVVPGLQRPAWLDRVFGTQLRWSVGGDALLVQSCGFARCLTRVVDTATGRIQIVDGPGQGALIGATGSQLVTYSMCPGLPCPVIAWDIDSGAGELLHREAFDVSLTEAPEGSARLLLETADGTQEVSL